MATCTPGSREQHKEWTEIYEEIKRDHDEAFNCIDKGIKLDEEGKIREAVEMYEFGVAIIDKALSLPLECPANPDISWEKAYVMIQKMRKTRKEITIRLSNIADQAEPAAALPPPSYEEAIALPSPSAVAQSASSSQSPIENVYLPPSAVDAHLSTKEPCKNGHVPTYAELSGQLGELQLAPSPVTKDILFQCENVRIYFISPDGRVSTPSEPNRLIIGKLQDESCGLLEDTVASVVSDLKSKFSNSRDAKKHHHHHHHHRPRHHGHRRHHRRHEREAHPRHGETTTAGDEEPGLVYIQVGSWLYPLIPGVSPCYRTDFGAFILPDVNAGVDGAAVGLILPQDVDEEVHEILADVLNSVAGLSQIDQEGKPKPRSRRSERPSDDTPATLRTSSFSSNLVKGATYIANNLVRGAGNTARFIDSTAPRLIEKMQPKPEPTPVNPSVKKSVEIAKNVSGTAANVTDYLATKLGIATSALGRYLAPHVQKQGTRLLTATTRMSHQEASAKIDTMLDVTSSAVESVTMVYGGLQTAAGLLGRSISDNTVQIIQHKYGEPMGTVTSDAFSTAGNIYTIRNNYKVLKPMGVAKTAAKSAGGAIIEEHRHSVATRDVSKPHEGFQGSGPGDGSGFSKAPL